MRLFTGIGVPDHIVENLTRLVDQLRPTASIQWIDAANFHITTRFIGQFPRQKLIELTDGLSTVGEQAPPEIRLNGLGCFPFASAPKTLFAAVNPSLEVIQVADATDRAVAEFGIRREGRKFWPHLTLARVKNPQMSLTHLNLAVERLAALDLGAFVAPSFHLYESRSSPAGSIYTRLAEIPFHL